jgi:ribosome-associated translation inhibitor RaiA
MQRPLQITSRDFTLTDAIETQIRKHAEALESFFAHLTGCHIVLEAPTVHHHRKGGPFNVRIILDVPRTQLTVNRQHAEDLSVAVRDAFDAARRKLEDYARELRGDVKSHATAAEADKTSTEKS